MNNLLMKLLITASFHISKRKKVKWFTGIASKVLYSIVTLSLSTEEFSNWIKLMVEQYFVLFIGDFTGWEMKRIWLWDGRVKRKRDGRHESFSGWEFFKKLQNKTDFVSTF